jgi:hypothetical protein
MSNLVLVSQAERASAYSAGHIRYLVGKGFVSGKKEGGIWLVDLDDLKRYERQMEELGDQKFDPTRGKDET